MSGAAALDSETTGAQQISLQSLEESAGAWRCGCVWVRVVCGADTLVVLVGSTLRISAPGRHTQAIQPSGQREY